jgi:hypothetical protein
MNFEIKKFSIKTIVDRCEIDSRKSPMIVLIGKKDTGKSFLVRDVLANTRDCFPVGTVISGTEVANPFFQDMVPSKLIHDKYKPEIVMNAIKRQLAVKQQRNHEKKQRGGASQIDPRAFLILDDCLYDKSWINASQSAINSYIGSQWAILDKKHAKLFLIKIMKKLLVHILKMKKLHNVKNILVQ